MIVPPRIFRIRLVIRPGRGGGELIIVLRLSNGSAEPSYRDKDKDGFSVSVIEFQGGFAHAERRRC
jgi:hypothetical protein